MTYPDYKFYCTCRTSRKVFGKDLPNHQLHTVAERCGYHLENHHHALADAEACAQIALLIIPEPKKAERTVHSDSRQSKSRDREKHDALRKISIA
jgi:DNA polymerase-3 subunit epsilon